MALWPAAKQPGPLAGRTDVEQLPHAIIIRFLDSDGLQQRAQTAMIAFVDRAAARQLLAALVGVDDFRRFLKAWAGWLAKTGLEAEMNRAEPGRLLEASK